MARPSLTRRRLLVSATAAGLAMPAIARGTERSALTIGVNAAQSGAFAPEGTEELRGARLAAAHVNGEGDGGMLATFSSGALTGTGILGRPLRVVDRDTEARADLARAGARAMIAGDRAQMLTGGSSSAVAVATQQLCQEAGVIYMAGLAHANAVTGRDRAAHGFRHFLNSEISAAALGPALGRLFGRERRAVHLFADNGWGREQQRALAAATEAEGWTTPGAAPLPITTLDYGAHLERAVSAGADVLVLDLYGGNLVAALRQAEALGLREREANGRRIEIVAPLLTELVADAAGAAIDGVVATQNWNGGREDPASRAFSRSYEAAYGRAPGQAAQTCYVQTLLYADAVARAGRITPCAVIEALEGARFAGLGNGPSLYRAADHQCFHEVLVVRGTAGGTPDAVEIVETVPPGRLTYPADHPPFRGGRLGACTRPS